MNGQRETTSRSGSGDVAPAIAITPSLDNSVASGALAGISAAGVGTPLAKSSRPKPLQKLTGLPKGLKLNLRKGSNRSSTPADTTQEPLGLLCVRVIAARNLASKDRNGKSDPFLHLRIGDARSESEVIKASLNPVWGDLEGVSNTAVHQDGKSSKEAVVVGPVWQESLARTRIEVTAWDKDRFQKNEYLGEISLGLQDWVNTSKHQVPVAYSSPNNEAVWRGVTSSRGSKTKVSGELLVKIGWVTPAVANASEMKTTQKNGKNASQATPFVSAYSSAQSALALMRSSSVSQYTHRYPLPDTQIEKIRNSLVEATMLAGMDQMDLSSSQGRKKGTVNRMKSLTSLRSKRASMAEDRIFTAPPSEGVGTLRIGDKTRGALSQELTDEHQAYASSSSSSSISDDEEFDQHGMLDDAHSGLDDVSSSSSSVGDAEDYTELDNGEGGDYFDLALGMQDAPKVQQEGQAASSRQQAGQDQYTTQQHLAPVQEVATPSGEKKRKLPLPNFLRRSDSSQSVKSVGEGGIKPHSVSKDVPVDDNAVGDDASPQAVGQRPGAYRRKTFTRRKVLVGGDDSADVGAVDVSGKGKGKEKHNKKRKKPKTGHRRKASGASNAGLSTGATADEDLGVVFIEVKGANNLPRWRNVIRTGWDMDPFCIVSFGQKVFRTRVIRHSRNPVWDEKLFFHVKRHEHAYQIMFTLFDWDKMSSNDFVGEIPLLLNELTEQAPKPDETTGIFPVTADGKIIGDDLRDFTLTLGSKSAELEEQTKNSSSLVIRAKFTPYSALRQRFWRTYLKQYDTDDSETWSYVELYSLLDSLGSTLSRTTIESFFTRYNKTSDGTLTAEEVVICLENELTKPKSEKNTVDSRQEGESGSSHSGMNTPNLESDNLPPLSLAENTTGMSFTGQPLTGEPASGVEVKDSLANGQQTLAPRSRKGSSSSLRKSSMASLTPSHTPARQSSLASQVSSSFADGGEHSHAGELEMLINIKTCPLCHKKLSKKAEVDMVSHLAVCASQDWSSLSSLTVANFVSASQAQRKWFTKLVNKVSNGSYKLGADSANILVQNRMTGQMQEEKMQVYVRVGIRLWYRAAGSSSRMEANRIKKLLRSMTVKQGIKFDAPESVAEIPRFIAFHQLNMKEVLDPVESFPHFNAFFYRKLKPDARPVADLEDPTTLVSGADCRMTAFQTITEATNIWIKGRTFSIKKLLGDEYKDDASKYEGGSMCIFRLAPQDYHRFHSAVDGTVGKISKISGEYYTVNPIAIRSSLDVYAENTRVIVPIDSPTFGRVYNVCIGAMMVGGINITKNEGEHVKRGEDFGYYSFGGSTSVLLFPPSPTGSPSVQFDQDIVNNSTACIETLVRVGMRIGKRI